MRVRLWHNLVVLVSVLLAATPLSLQAAPADHPRRGSGPIQFTKSSVVIANTYNGDDFDHSGEFGLHSPYRRKLFEYQEGDLEALIAKVGFFSSGTPLVFYWKIDGVPGEFYSDAPTTETIFVDVQKMQVTGEFWTVNWYYHDGPVVLEAIQVAVWLPRLQLPFHRAAQPGPCGMTDFPQLQLYCVNSFFDHEHPDYSQNGELQRFFGGPVDANRCDASVPSLRWFCYDGHSGYDFRLTYDADDPNATLVLAADGGWVMHLAETCRGTGIQLQHPNGYFTQYWHLSQRLVGQGAWVDAGTPIGVVGSTGTCSTGPHLHFEVLNWGWEGVPGDVVDPFAWRGTRPDPHSARGHGWCLWEDGCPATAVTPQDGGLLSTKDGDIYVVVPGLAVTEDTILHLDLGPSPDAQPSASLTNRPLSASADSDTIPAGYFFSLSAEDLNGTPLESFSIPLTITINYTDTLPNYVSEDSLGIQSWSDQTDTWEPLTTTLDLGANTATANTDHLSLFALVGTPIHDPPVVTSVTPPSAKNNVDTTITVTGSNFLSIPSVELGSSALPVTLMTSNTLTATVPSGFPPGTYALSIVNPDTQASTWPGPFTVQQPFFLPLTLKTY